MGETNAPSCEATLTIRNPLGMHARAAAKFVQTAVRFRADVDVLKDGECVNGKSIMGVLMLVATQGSRILVRARGDDAAQAVEALRALVDGGFGEMDPPK